MCDSLSRINTREHTRLSTIRYNKQNVKLLKISVVRSLMKKIALEKLKNHCKFKVCFDSSPVEFCQNCAITVLAQ